jgi:hypothetical protein
MPGLSSRADAVTAFHPDLPLGIHRRRLQIERVLSQARAQEAARAVSGTAQHGTVR